MDPTQTRINDGKGRFSQGQVITWSNLNPNSSVTLADFDGDGDLDAWLACNGGIDTGKPDLVCINDGKGRFKDSGQKLGVAYSNSVALGDIDGDGDLDAVVGTGSTEEKSPDLIWINDGKGAFASDEKGDKSEGGLSFRSNNAVALGDIDGDKDLDAVIACIGANHIWINDGKAKFTGSEHDLGSATLLLDRLPSVSSRIKGVYPDMDIEYPFDHSNGVALGDVDGDGHLDEIVANQDDAPSRVWFNQGKDVFDDR